MVTLNTPKNISFQNIYTIIRFQYMKADEQLFVAARPFPKNLKINNQRI